MVYILHISLHDCETVCVISFSEQVTEFKIEVVILKKGIYSFLTIEFNHVCTQNVGVNFTKKSQRFFFFSFLVSFSLRREHHIITV